MSRFILRFALGALPAAALCLAFILHARHLHEQAVQSMIHMSAGQVLDRSEPLCRLIAPHTSSLRLTAEAIPIGKFHPHWEVKCADPSGQDLAYLNWDAGTGQLISVSHVFYSSQGMGRSLDRHKAAMEAWNWLCALRIAGQASHWRLAGSPQCSGYTWTVRWSAADRRAVVQFYPLTHELSFASCTPLSASRGIDYFQVVPQVHPAQIWYGKW